MAHSGYFLLGPLLATIGSILLLSSIFHEPGSIVFSGRTDVSDLPWKCFNITEPSSQVVFMLIDAWRYDFLASPDSPMQFVRSQLATGQGVLMRSRVQVPTVTQPRIKALTAGVNPSFASLLGNFFSYSMTSETWLSQARRAGKKLNFYGDDTWLKLFPGYFVDSLGVPSFNVLDFTEVDNQVTRRMRQQINSDKWDIMILHFLGLDHIGHSQGGESPEIPKKLKEMDDVIREMYFSTRNLTIVILGDHGMTLQGSHGGSHSSETQTPVVVLSTGATPVDSRPSVDEMSTIQQVDVVSLMSFLLKQPIPSASVGTSVLSVLQKTWFMPNSQLIFDFLLHLPQWGSVDEKAAYLAEILRKPNRSCLELERSFDYHVLREFHQQTKNAQKGMLFHRQPIGGPVYNIGICLLLAGAAVSFWLTRVDSFASWDNLFLLLPLLCTASSSFVEEEHEIWYYCVCGVVSVFLWKSTRCSSTVVNCLLILALHRFASSASAGIRRRWAMHPDLLPGLLCEDSTVLRPVRSFGDWLQSVVFPIADGSSVGGVYLFLLAVLTFYNSSSPAAWIAFLLQASAAICYLAGWQIWLSIVVYLSSWCWMFLLWWSPVPALILFISYIIRPTFIPVILSTYIMGRISKKEKLSSAATASLLCSSLFYTGLSNSISSIDIRAGYGGVLEYHPLVVGIQILANMYASFLFFLIGFGKSNITQHVIQYLIILRILMVILSSSFLILFTEHLFIWTVFTPKVIFDILHFFLLLLCYISTMCILS